jgi:hypothetical protein
MLKTWLAEQPIIALTVIDNVVSLENPKIHHITHHKYATSNYLLEKININLSLLTKSDVSGDKNTKYQITEFGNNGT